MRMSRYNILFEENSKSYLYNTLTTGLCELDDVIAEKVASNSLADISAEHVQSLINGGFVVEDDADEVLQYQAFYDSTRFGVRSRTLLIGLLPTYSCNLKCPYCLQGEEKVSKKMTPEQVSAVVKLVRNRIAESGREVPIDFVHVELYGGEPLLCKTSITSFCDSIEALSREFLFKTKFTMTSNFVLVDDDILELIGKHRIKVQVTVDGTREQHDRRRIQHDGSGTYEKIIANLKKLNNRGLRDCITIRINVDKDNISNVRETLKDLAQYSDSIYFSYTESFAGRNEHYQDCLKKECHSEISINVLNENLRELGLAIPKLFGKRGPCTLNERNKFFIDCDMNVYNCELLVKHPDLSVGVLNLDGTIRFNSLYYSFLKHTPLAYKECRNCKLLPNCAGGCPVKNRLSEGEGDICSTLCELSENDLVMYLKEFVRNNKEI